MTSLMALDLGRASKALLSLIVAGTAMTAVAGTLGVYDAVVYVGCILLLAIPAAMISRIMYLQEERCGWLTFAASAGISRRRIIASRILALLILSIPVADIPAICTVMMSPMEDHILASLGIGTYLAGIGYGCMVCFPRPYENVSHLRCMIGQFAFLAASVLALLAVDAVTGDVAVGFAVCVAMGFATMAWTYVLAVDRFARTDL